MLENLLTFHKSILKCVDQTFFPSIEQLLLSVFYLKSLHSTNSLFSPFQPAAKMKIVLLGATGDTGKPLLRQCLDHNHSVTGIIF